MDDITTTPAPRKRSGSQTRQRGYRLTLRLSLAEQAEIEAGAERVGLTPSSYVRGRALAQQTTRAIRRPTVERAALSQILAQLGKCGSNLNQIARVLNSGGERPADTDEAIADFRAAVALIMQTMGKRPQAGGL